MSDFVSDPLAFLSGGGEAARMIRARDWSEHPLGPPGSWPPELRAALSLVLNSPESMILAWGEALHFFFNDTYFPLLGPRLPWAMGERFDKVWADGWDQAKPIIDEAMAGRPKRFVDLPWRLDTDRGAAETWWSFSYSRVLNADGAVAGLFIVTNETTESVRTDAARRASEAALRESEDHFRHTVELNPQVPWTCDPQGNITSYSKRWLDLTGQADGEPLGQGWAKALHPDDVAPTVAVFSACLASGEPVDVDYRIRVPSARAYRWMRARAYPRRDEAGAIVAWYGVVEDIHDRRLAEAALRESEAFLQRVLASSPDCIKVLDLDGNLAFMSEGGMRVMEVDDFEAVRGRLWSEFWRGPLHARAREAVAAARAGGTGQFQGPAPTFAGMPRWWDVRVTPILGADGRPERLLAVSRDLSEQRAAREALASSEARYRTLFESIDEGFCIIEFLDGPHGPASDYVHVEANPAYSRHAGIPDVVGQRVRAMVPDEAGGWVALYGGVLRTGEPVRFERELVATGRHLDVAAFRIEPASRRQVAVLFRDVTGRKRAETALRQLNETLEARVFEALAERNVLADIVEGTDAFVQVLAPDYAWLAINGAAAREFARIFGILPKVGDNMLDLLADQPEQQAALRAVWARALAGEEFVEIAAFGDPNRERRHHEMRFNTLRDAEGRQIGAYQFVYDVTDRLMEQERLRQTEEALRQSQKMEAVGQLTGGIAHDFNNLLTGIIGSLELLNTRIAQGRLGDVERYTTAAQGAARRAAALTHRLLAFSRRQTLDPRPTDVNRLVAGMEELIRRTVGPSVTIETVAAGGLWPTLIDPPQLENALLNLCINARDAMPAGGRITIETANTWLDRRAARERDLAPGQYISLCASDTGTGMAPEIVAKVFEPFFTTKPLGQGTGLGLSMVYGFVRQSGGQVRIYSEVGQGTNVCLYLPRHLGAEAMPEAPPELASAPKAEAGETVLVVDDEPTVRMLVAEVLEELGYAAIEAADGPSGLKVLRSDARIDLLVTDVGLPGGMNGRQLADAARETRKALKVLFITGYAENAAIGNGHLAHGMHVLTKPFAMESLAARIRELIAQA